MKKASEVTALYLDNGPFHSFALKLAETYKKVYYAPNWKSSFPAIEDALVGSQFEDGEKIDTFEGLPLEVIENIFDVIDECDILITPDVYNGDIAAYFHEKGKPVFGAMYGEMLELERYEAKEIFKEYGMDVKDAKRIIGVDNLKKYLEKKKDKVWIKISKYRKLFETFAHTDYRFTELILDKLAYKLGPLKSVVEFLVEPDIPDATEEGIDTFFTDGKFPEHSIQGIEIKGVSYFGEFVKYEDLSEAVRDVNEKIAPILKKCSYQGAFSTEIRTTGKEHFLLEPTTRLPSPCNELYQEMYEDIGEVVWMIGNGKMPELKSKKRYGLQVVLNINWQDDESTHLAVYFPEEYRKNIKLKNPIIVDGQHYALLINDVSEVGALITMGDTPEECKTEMLKIMEEIKYSGMELNPLHIDEAIEEYAKMSKKK